MRSRIYARLRPQQTRAQRVAVAVGSAKARAIDIGDRFGPAVVDARNRIAPVVERSRDRVAPVVSPVVAASRDRIVPVVSPVVADARDRVAPMVGDARIRLADLAESVAVKLDADRAEPVVIEVEERRRPKRFLRLVMITGLSAAAFSAAKRLRGSSGPRWESDTPSDLPGQRQQGAPTPTVATPAAAVTGMLAADSPDLEVAGADAAGGNPEEAAADAVETPHPVTTPDAPAQRVILD